MAVVALDDPSSRNALSRPLLEQLTDLLDELHAMALDPTRAPALRAVVLTHTPPVFCSGADLRERRAQPGTAAGAGGRAMAQAIGRLMTINVPTIAAVDGAVRAGGIGLMAACDLVVVGRDVDLVFSETRIGVAPAVISVPVLARCPWSAVAGPMLTGERITADHARAIGLVTHVTDEVVATVDRLCAGIMAGGPGAVAATKRLLRDRSGDGRALTDMAAYSDELFAGDEAQEGIRAFFERRAPSWAPPADDRAAAGDTGGDTPGEDQASNR